MIVAAYIILGFAYIGQEIENPFGHDVNDLPLDKFCNQIAADVHIIAASGPRKAETFIKNKHNRIMHPLSHSSYESWKETSVEDIKETLKRRALLAMENLKPRVRSHQSTNRDNRQYGRVRASSIEEIRKVV
jgi:putative membrane protein